MTDLTDLLSRRGSDIKEPQPLPPGQYLFQVDSWKQGRTSQTGTPSVDFTVKAMSALDGVESDALADVSFPVELRHTFYVSEKSSYRLRNFLRDSLGIVEIDNVNIYPDGLNMAPGRVFRGNITHRTNPNNPGRFFAEINETFPAE